MKSVGRRRSKEQSGKEREGTHGREKTARSTVEGEPGERTRE